MNTFAVPHFLHFKHLAPLLKDDPASSFNFISGAGGMLTDCQVKHWCSDDSCHLLLRSDMGHPGCTETLYTR